MNSDNILAVVIEEYLVKLFFPKIDHIYVRLENSIADKDCSFFSSI